MDSENYPANLQSRVFDPYLFDVEADLESVKCNANRLFVSNNKTAVQVMDMGSNLEPAILDFRQLDEYLARPALKGVQIMSIAQQTSWGKFWISFDMFRKTLIRFDVFATVFDLLSAFGEFTSPINESMGCCQILSQPNFAVTEICYLVKYIERNERDSCPNPWSIRQIGIYHKRNFQKDEDAFILLNPSGEFSKRLRAIRRDCGDSVRWEGIHILVLASTSRQWGAYLDEINEKIIELKTRAHNSDLRCREEGSQSGAVWIEFPDMQQLEVLHDELHSIRNMLTNNLGVSHRIASLFKYGSEAHGSVEVCISRTVQNRQRVETMIARLDSVAKLVQAIVSVRGLTALQSSSASSTEIMELARVDSNTMVDLSRKAYDNSRSLKTITILTLIYLPASFASLLSMGYITFNRKAQPVALHLASELWIFLGLTIILLALTVGWWLFLDWRRRNRAAGHGADCVSDAEDKV